MSIKTMARKISRHYLRRALPALPAITEQAEESNASESERPRFGDDRVRLQIVVYHIITCVGQCCNAHGGCPAVPLEGTIAGAHVGELLGTNGLAQHIEERDGNGRWRRKTENGACGCT